MARESKISGYSDQELRELGAKGLFDLGLYASVGGAWNALFDPKNGRLAGEKDTSAPAERKPRQSKGKRKGYFPNRASVVQCLNKYLNNITNSEDPDWIDNPTWSDYKSCLAKNGLQWQAFIMGKAKGEEEINAFSLWITSNGEADLAESEQSKAQQKALDAAVKLIEAAGGTVTW